MLIIPIPGSPASVPGGSIAREIIAAAGIDESNVNGARLLLLPEGPDLAAQTIAEEIQQQTGQLVGILVRDTAGKPGRVGQTDIAIEAANTKLVDDVRGSKDAGAKIMSVTQRCIGDEISADADLVEGKATSIPVALFRGLSQHVTPEFTGGARSIICGLDEDLFRMGTAQAIAEGKRQAQDGELAR